jgi:hypothetical protein
MFKPKGAIQDILAAFCILQRSCGLFKLFIEGSDQQYTATPAENAIVSSVKNRIDETDPLDR